METWLHIAIQGIDRIPETSRGFDFASCRNRAASALRAPSRRRGRGWPRNPLRASVIITTNLEFGEWVSVFGDARMTTALLDRLTHHCEIVETGNESWRFKNQA